MWKVVGLIALCVFVGAKDPTDDGEESGDHEPHWGYHGTYTPDNWGLLDKRCLSTNDRQSPIDIDPINTLFDDDLTKVDLQETHRKKSYEFSNNGHSVNIKVEHEALVVGGNLPSKGYRIAGVHFHWGSSDAQGSEHTVDGNKFPLEMHMVTYDSERYPELGTDAVFGSDSLAVLGTMFKISEQDNPILAPIIDGLKRIQHAGDKTTIRSFPMSTLLPEQTNKYFRYYGSLTTPPCAESVVWTLFLHTQTISSAQLAVFREVMEADNTHNIVDNWRPAQPIHKRLVYRSFLFKSEMSQVIVDYGSKEASHSAATSPVVSVFTVFALLSSFLF